MKKILFLSTLLVGSLLNAAQLSDFQLKLLESAKVLPAADQPQVVHIKVDGEDKIVVLFGETHVKNDARAAVYLNIFRGFKFRGVEGVSQDDVQAIGAQKIGAFVSFVQEVASLLASFGVHSHQSSIMDASMEGFLIEDDLVFFNGLPLGDLINVDDRATSSDDLILNAMWAREVIDGRLWAFKSIKVPNSPLKSQKDIGYPVNINIEYGDIRSWIHGVCGDRAEDDSCDKIVKVRNYRMADNIVANLRSFNTQPVMLVLVGSGHVAGLKEILSKGDL